MWPWGERRETVNICCMMMNDAKINVYGECVCERRWMACVLSRTRCVGDEWRGVGEGDVGRMVARTCMEEKKEK